MAENGLIRLIGVSKTYAMGEVQVNALRDMDLEVKSGEFLVLLGPSGSGKTTTLNLIGGLDRPSEGQILVEGDDISRYDERRLTLYRRHVVGFIFQFFNLIPTLTAQENVEFALELAERDGHVVKRKASDLMELVGLADRANHFPSQLSGGEQQRVAIARALAKQPRIMLCDEPTGNLDVDMGVHVLQTMRDLNEREGTNVVLVTHNTAIAAMADRVVRLRDGTVVESTVNEKPTDPTQITW
jgi:putative ABC transport system ATP-binding protein